MISAGDLKKSMVYMQHTIAASYSPPMKNEFFNSRTLTDPKTRQLFIKQANSNDGIALIGIANAACVGPEKWLLSGLTYARLVEERQATSVKLADVQAAIKLLLAQEDALSELEYRHYEVLANTRSRFIAPELNWIVLLILVTMIVEVAVRSPGVAGVLFYFIVKAVIKLVKSKGE